MKSLSNRSAVIHQRITLDDMSTVVSEADITFVLFDEKQNKAIVIDGDARKMLEAMLDPELALRPNAKSGLVKTLSHRRGMAAARALLKRQQTQRSALARRAAADSFVAARLQRRQEGFVSIQPDEHPPPGPRSSQGLRGGMICRKEDNEKWLMIAVALVAAVGARVVVARWRQ